MAEQLIKLTFLDELISARLFPVIPYVACLAEVDEIFGMVKVFVLSCFGPINDVMDFKSKDVGSKASLT